MSAPDSESDKRTFRTPTVVWTAVALLVGAAGFVLWGVLTPRGQTAVMGVAAVTALIGVRISRAGIRVQPDGVKLVGALFGARRVAWSDLDHFAVMPRGRYPHTAYAVLKDGRKYSVLALSAAGEAEASRAQIDQAVEALNQALDRNR